MDLKKVAIIKPARGNYDAGTTYAYHSEWAQCIAGVAGGALFGGGGAGIAASVTVRVAGLAMGPWGWVGVGLVAAGGALTGYAEYC